MAEANGEGKKGCISGDLGNEEWRKHIALRSRWNRKDCIVDGSKVEIGDLGNNFMRNNGESDGD